MNIQDLIKYTYRNTGVKELFVYFVTRMAIEIRIFSLS